MSQGSGRIGIETCDVEVPPEAGGAVWSIKAEPTEGHSLSDFCIQLSGDCIPLLSDAPGRVLQPLTEREK